MSSDGGDSDGSPAPHQTDRNRSPRASLESLTGGEYSDAGGLSDGDISLPPRHKRYVQSVQEALAEMQQSLSQVQTVVPEPIRENFQRQTQSLARLLERWQGPRRRDSEGSGGEGPDSPAAVGPPRKNFVGGFTNSQRRRLGEALRALNERRQRTLRGLRQAPRWTGNLRHAATATAAAARRKGVGGVVKEMRTKTGAMAKRRADAVRRRVRAVMTGDSETRVRDFLEQQLQRPLIVRLLDKFGFLLGVLSLLFTEFLLLSLPAYFWLWYAVAMPLMIACRYPEYRFRKWGYFLLDFCYFAQVMNLTQAAFLPESCSLFKVNFAFALGPLACAVILWRNSLVFHDRDKVTTVYIHVFPSWLVYATRWITGGGTSRLASLGTCPPFSAFDYFHATAWYVVWQALYFLKTEVIDAKLIDSDPDVQTSLRWLALDCQRPINKLVLGLTRSWGFVGKDEVFDPTTVKTKVIFMASQLVYTMLTLLPVPLYFYSRSLCTFWAISVFCVSVYNGGEYYIEVFSRRYYRQFEKDAQQQDTGVMDSNDAPPGQQQPLPSMMQNGAQDTPPPIVSDDEGRRAGGELRLGDEDDEDDDEDDEDDEDEEDENGVNGEEDESMYQDVVDDVVEILSMLETQDSLDSAVVDEDDDDDDDDEDGYRPEPSSIPRVRSQERLRRRSQQQQHSSIKCD